jgi:spore coat polysaccharide biosynthesis protein SpsF
VAVKNSEDLSALRWSVDQQQDLDCVRAIYERLGDIPFGWRDVLELVRREPALAAFNSGIAFNEGYAVSLAQDHPVELAKGGNQ